MKGIKLVKPNIDIRDVPESQNNPLSTDITIGDLHANALLLLYFLVSQGIVEMSPDDYVLFSELYTHSELQPRMQGLFGKSALIFSSLQSKKKLEDINAQFNQLIGSIKVIDTKKLIRFIGDELVDRGVSDYFILKLFEMLHAQGANFEILLSNHGVEFIEACERFKEKGNELIAPRISIIEHGNSMIALKKSIAAGAVTHEEVLDMYHRVYKKHLKLISYSVDVQSNEIHVFSHAPIGINHIQGLANKFSVPYLANSAIELAQTIDAINAAFSEKITANEVHSLYTHEMMTKGYSGKKLDDKEEVVAATVWGREYQSIVRTASGFKVIFIHGHDSKDHEEKIHVTLNEALGQFNAYQGEFQVYSTDGQQLGLMPTTECTGQFTLPRKVVYCDPLTHLDLDDREKNTEHAIEPVPVVVPVPAVTTLIEVKTTALPQRIGTSSNYSFSLLMTLFRYQPNLNDYNHIWNQEKGNSEIREIKGLLRDYTKEGSILGSLFGRLVSGYWNRHHVNQLHQILQKKYESSDELISDLKKIKCNKGGSLDRRIQFIENKIASKLQDFAALRH